MRPTALRYASVLALAMLCAASDTKAGGDQPLPYRLVVVVEWGQPAGPASFRAELQRELLTEISAANCFRAVHADAATSPGADDLKLRVTVHAYNEEIEFEFGVADRAAPGADLDRLTVARIQAGFHAEVRTAVEDAVVREDHFRQQSAWRPLYHEDPRVEAQLRMIDAVARTTRRFACKGSAGRWSKQLESARATLVR
jgi:hypothetical protein